MNNTTLQTDFIEELANVLCSKVIEEIKPLLIKQEPDQLLSVKEAAAILKYHPGHLKRLIHQGKIKAQQTGRRIFILQSEIDRLLGLRNEN